MITCRCAAKDRAGADPQVYDGLLQVLFITCRDSYHQEGAHRDPRRPIADEPMVVGREYPIAGGDAMVVDETVVHTAQLTVHQVKDSSISRFKTRF